MPKPRLAFIPRPFSLGVKSETQNQTVYIIVYNIHNFSLQWKILGAPYTQHFKVF